MTRVLISSIGSAILILAGAGCNGGFAFHYHDDSPPPRHVVVDHGHVCTASCSHYYDGTRYVVVRRGHVHGPGCGHSLIEGRWVVVAKAPAHHHVAPVAHSHQAQVRVVRIPPPPGPVNYFVYDRSGSKWMRIQAGHVHGPGCGHVIIDGHWCMH